MNSVKINDLSFYNDMGIISLSAKQYDTGRKFVFRIVDNDEPFDLTGCDVYLRIIKADKTQFQGEGCCVIENNNIIIDTSLGNGNQILASDGQNICELHLTDSNGKSLTTWNFVIDVQPRVHNGDNIDSTDSWDVLDYIQETAEDFNKKLEEHYFVLTLDKDVAGGVPSLDKNVKVPISELYEATASGKGITQLTDSVTSTSTTTAATPNSVKTVNDALTAEKDRATSVETTLKTDLNNEVTRAKNAEENLNSKKVDKTTVATSSVLGLVKSGTDITVDSSGNMSVNDNSHKHTVSNISDLTATAGELNILDGITATTTELNYTDGVTGNIQAQLNSKAPLASPTFTGTPTAPTAPDRTDTTQIATTAFTQNAVSSHNTSTVSHTDIRDLITDLADRLNALADSDDTTLDQLSEIVAYIKSNRTLIESVTTNKVNVSDIIDSLTSTATNKPLSANQGRILKELIEGIGNASNGASLYKQTVDLSDSQYDQNTWYPVVGDKFLRDGNFHRLITSNFLDPVCHPSWGNHPDGFSCNLDVLVMPSGWGTTYGQNICLNWGFNWTNDTKNPCGFAQMLYASRPVFYLRGGGIYNLYSDYNCNWNIKKDGYSEYDESVSPTSEGQLQLIRGTIYSNLSGDVYGTAEAARTVKDSGDGRALTFNYSAESVPSAQYLAAWNGNELRAITPDHITAGNADTVDGSHASSFLGNGTGYIYPWASSEDLNDYKSEYHGFVFNMVNTPSGATYGFLDVSCFDGAMFSPSASGVIRQVFTQYNTGKMYIRNYVSDRWEMWHSFVLSNDVLVIGDGAYAAFADSIAIGNNAYSEKDESVALGYCASTGDTLRGIAIGCNARVTGVIGEGGIALGYDADAWGQYCMALGYAACADGEKNTALGYAARAYPGDNHTMQLGTNDYLSVLRCNVSLSVTSDIRDKANIVDIDRATDFLSEITPFTYVQNQRSRYAFDEDILTAEQKENFKKYGFKPYDKEAHEQGSKKGERRRAGVSAQEIMDALIKVYGSSDYANLVNDNLHDVDPNEIPEEVENHLTVTYENFIPFLIKAVQELNGRIKELETKIEVIESGAEY